MTKQTVENIRETFILGLKGVYETSEIGKKFFKKLLAIVSIATSFILPGIAKYLKVDYYKLIVDIQTLMVNFLPCILGFTIAGYTLVVGFVQANMLDKITEPAKDSKFSLYQKMSGTFAINIIFQAVALFIAYIYHFAIFFDANKGKKIIFPDVYISYVNMISLWFIVLWFTLSLLIVVQIVLNIFQFSQLHHYFIVRSKIDMSLSSNDNQNCKK